MRFDFNKKEFVEFELSPEKLAVIGADRAITWLQFSDEVDSFCAQFRAMGFGDSENPVVVYGHKNADMLVAMYALMKMEITYIPIDIIYPEDRAKRVVEVSGCHVLVNTTGNSARIEDVNEISLRQGKMEHKQKGVFESRKDVEADPLVYMIFTSGSTGEPKGVMISSEAVQSFTRWMCNDFGFNADDVFVNTAILSFDLSVFEVMTFGALGATLLLNTKEVGQDPNLLMDRVAEYNGSVWVSTPSFMLIYSRMKGESRMDSVKSFLFCGEVLPNDTAQKLLDNFPQARVLNTCGPTEATVATTLVEITSEIIAKHNPLPVGSSKPESELLIEAGEIVIVGPNVSRGYVANPELNAQKFVERNGQRAFKTGDKGYLENGMLFFHGRDDDMVKLHGYRIELNEINAVMNELDYVMHAESIALKRNGAVKKIVAVAKLNNTDSDAAQIKMDMAKKVPPYMIPSDIKVIDEIPLNQNGKVNKQLLQELYLKR